MRILHFCMHAPFTENYSYQDNLLSEYQHKHGHELRVVSITKKWDENGNLVNTESGYQRLNNGVELVRIKTPGKIKIFLGCFSGISTQLLDYKPDFVFIHGLCSFIPGEVISYKQKYNPDLRIVADNHQDTITTKVDFPYSFQFFVHRLFWKMWINDIDKVYGTTSWRSTFANEYYGIPKDKIDTLIMGVDSDKLPQDKKSWKLKVRSKLRIPDNTFVFISGGKMDKDKKFIQSISAFSKIKNSNLRYLIFGSVLDDIKEDFESLIDKDDRIIYLGFVPSDIVWKYYFASDFGLFPGRHSVLWEEAIGCGLPCLFHRYEEKDHTEVCGNCICIEQSDVDTLYRNMKKVLENKEYYAQLKANAEKASSEFSYHTIAEKSIECCYEDRK